MSESDNMAVIVDYTDSLKKDVFRFTDDCFEGLGKVFEPRGRHSFYNDIPGNFDHFWCLISDGSVKGTVAVKRMDDSTAELKALYLASELRGKGYGHNLLDTAVSYAKARGYKRIVLDSMAIYEDALRLYDRYGFKHIPRYNDNSYADIFMEYSFV
ncbi:MAG: GNAT family N-acetyltransferase [Saccharofermentans sp.]|nr:GNAT family N-acetyltransferase [Saccharofermentans sp.]